MLMFHNFFRTPPLPSISPSVTLPSSQELELDSFGFFSVFQAHFRHLFIGLPRVLCYGSHATLREVGRDNDLTWYWIGKTLSPQEVPCNAGDVPPMRQHAWKCAQQRLRARSPTQGSGGPTGRWRGNTRATAAATHTQLNSHPSYIDRVPSPSYPIALKLSKSIEHLWYDASPANQGAAAP